MIRIYRVNDSMSSRFMDVNEEATFCIYSKGGVVECHRYLPPVSGETVISFEDLLEWLGEHSAEFIENMGKIIIDHERSLKSRKTSPGEEICYA